MPSPGEGRAAEELVVISASEASEDEQEEDDEISIVLDASSDVLVGMVPPDIERREDTRSRRCGETTFEEGDVPLTEWTSVPSAQFT